jgi:peroxin-3
MDSTPTSLRTRFTQTQEDVAYTVLALLPTLSEQVLQDMDVDTLTRELQARSKARTSRTLPAQPTSRPPSSLASSIVEVAAYPPAPYPPIAPHDVDADARSDVESVAHSSETGSQTDERYAQTASSSRSVYQTATSASFISETTSVTRSWVVDVDTAERPRSPAASGISETSSAAGDERMVRSQLFLQGYSYERV